MAKLNEMTRVKRMAMRKLREAKQAGQQIDKRGTSWELDDKDNRVFKRAEAFALLWLALLGNL